MKNTILIVDFGSQYTQLIARRIRSLGFYSEIVACYNFDLKKYNIDEIGALILSGGPNSIHEENSPNITEEIFEIDKPILGICYGMQLISHNLGGIVEQGSVREFGSMKISIEKNSLLTDNWCESKNEIQTWMSHGDCVKKIPEGFEVVAYSSNQNLAIIQNEKKKIYGIQFHPEVNNTENGNQLLLNFITKISNIQPNWSMGNVIENKLKSIAEIVGDDSIVIAGVSGGVDSTVAAVLTHTVICERLKCIFIDTGLLRKNEGDEVCAMFAKHNISVEKINAEDIFLEKLKGITDPEEKRKIIGKLFIELFDK